MARPRNENRDKVADVAFNIRITPTEKRALELLREQQVEVLRQQGVLAQVSTAAVTRMLIQEAAREKLGGWPPPGDVEPELPGMTITPKAAPKPNISTPDPTPDAQTKAPPTVEEVRDVIEANTDKAIGMTFVPEVVRSLGGDVGDVHAVLLDGARAGRWELRPESGMGRLSTEEKAMCIETDNGLLSVVRLMDQKAAAELDAEAVRKRLKRVWKKHWETQQGLAAAATRHLPDGAKPIQQAVVSRFLVQGKGIAPERVVAFDALLREVGA